MERSWDRDHLFALSQVADLFHAGGPDFWPVFGRVLQSDCRVGSGQISYESYKRPVYHHGGIPSPLPWQSHDPRKRSSNVIK